MIGIENYLFQSYGHCCLFQICWHIKCITFIASSFRIWNSSTGIPSPPLALLILLLIKAHMTLNYRLSDSRWVITPSWLSESWRSFLYISSVYSCHLFLISSTSVRSLPFLSYCMKCSRGISNFLEEISSLSHSVVFLYFFDCWRRLSYLSLLFFRTLHSNGYIFSNMLWEISGEITPEQMKRQSQSKNNTQLWICQVMKVKSDTVKSNMYRNLEC